MRIDIIQGEHTYARSETAVAAPTVLGLAQQVGTCRPLVTGVTCTCGQAITGVRLQTTPIISWSHKGMFLKPLREFSPTLPLAFLMDHKPPLSLWYIKRLD